MMIRRNQQARGRGMAMIVVIALMAIVLVFMAGNARTLYYLSRNVRLVEEAQKRHLQAKPGPAAKAPATVKPESSSTNAVANPPAKPLGP